MLEKEYGEVNGSSNSNTQIKSTEIGVQVNTIKPNHDWARYDVGTLINNKASHEYESPANITGSRLDWTGYDTMHNAAITTKAYDGNAAIDDKVQARLNPNASYEAVGPALKTNSIKKVVGESSADEIEMRMTQNASHEAVTPYL